MRRILAALAAALTVTSAHAVDSISAEYGVGTRGVDEWRVGVQWLQEPSWLVGTNWRLYWDATIGNWSSDTGALQDAGLTPTLRYGHEHGLYVDGGIGYHVLSERRISSNIGFSTKFQFGDHLGVGYRSSRYDVSMRLQHLSNAGIRNPNPGINFMQVRVQYWLDKP